MSYLSPQPEQSTEEEIAIITALSNLATSGVGFAIAKTATGFENVAISGGSVSDEAYGITWDGVTDEAASKNTIYDKIESLVSITVSTIEPTSPITGDVWIDIS